MKGILVQIALIGSAIQIFVGTGCRDGSARSTDKIVSTLRHCPDWTTSTEDLRAKSKVINALDEINQYDTSAIRSGVVEYLSDKGTKTVGGFSKVFLLNRFIFDVPHFVSLEEPLFGPWRNPVVGDQVDLQWPFTKTADGHLSLTGTFLGYTGDDPRVLDEFDDFAKRYGRRNKASQK